MLRQSAAIRTVVRPTLAKAGGYGQKRAAHAISNPTLANIEKRWEGLPPQEQADLWMALRDRMKVNWAELTLQEKKAGEFSFSHISRWREGWMDGRAKMCELRSMGERRCLN